MDRIEEIRAKIAAKRREIKPEPVEEKRGKRGEDGLLEIERSIVKIIINCGRPISIRELTDLYFHEGAFAESGKEGAPDYSRMIRNAVRIPIREKIIARWKDISSQGRLGFLIKGEK